jgi:hypothetical protein
MFTSLLALFLVLPAPVQDAKPIIDNIRVTVHELKSADSKPTRIEKRGNDVVAVDLDATTAFFIPKGSQHNAPRHGIVIDLKDVSVPPLENKTKYPLAFPRPGVKKILENNRVLIWDYTWTPG